MLKSLIKAMRPKQWSKNGLIFAGVFFDGRVFDVARLSRSVAAFVMFCLLSSAIYLANDLIDIDRDRIHPVKRGRPLASGALPKKIGIAAAIVLVVVSMVSAFAISLDCGLVALAYIALNIVYSYKLKHIVIVDVMVVAAFYVIRVMAGTVVAQVTRFSPWLYVCTTLLALFVAINKRRHELVLLNDKAHAHRSILRQYTPAFLDNMTSVVTATALTAYSFYTFSAPNLPENHTMMLTIPFVLYGVFRYLYLIHARNLGGAPEDLFLSDKPLLLDLALFGLTAALVLYWPLIMGA